MGIAAANGNRRPPHILRVAGTLGAVLLIFIVWIAAYALWLRVDQYGWTVDRIYSAACVLVGGMFAVGYLVAALLPGYWLKLIERWNVYGTFVFLAVLFALSYDYVGDLAETISLVWPAKAGVQAPPSRLSTIVERLMTASRLQPCGELHKTKGSTAAVAFQPSAALVRCYSSGLPGSSCCPCPSQKEKTRY